MSTRSDRALKAMWGLRPQHGRMEQRHGGKLRVTVQSSQPAEEPQMTADQIREHENEKSDSGFLTPCLVLCSPRDCCDCMSCSVSNTTALSPGLVLCGPQDCCCP